LKILSKDFAKILGPRANAAHPFLKPRNLAPSAPENSSRIFVRNF
jgi:hypothetical protein